LSHNSICDIVQLYDIDLASAHKTLKKKKFHSYKIHIVQELSHDDFKRDRILRFDDRQNHLIAKDPQFQNNIAFSDEATFTLTAKINRHNCRWNNENPH